MTSNAGGSVLARLQAILADLLVLKPADIRPESRLVDDLEADSITFIELAFTIEKEFGVRLPDVKADERTLSLPLPDGLNRLESMPGSTTFFEFLKHEAIRDVLGPETRPEELAHAERERLFRSHTVATIARAARAEVPEGLDPAAPITSLRLRDLLRFLTVGAMAGYIEHLLAEKKNTPA